MNDYLSILEQYNSVHEIAEIADDVKRLRQLYITKQYDAMKQHIHHLMPKYPDDTVCWNSTHPDRPCTDEQWYLNAEAFMKTKGISALMKYGIKDPGASLICT